MSNLPKKLKIILCIISFVTTSCIDAKPMSVLNPEYEPGSMSSSSRGRSMQRKRSQSIPARAASRPAQEKTVTGTNYFQTLLEKIRSSDYKNIINKKGVIASDLVADIQNAQLASEQKRALLEAAVALQLPLSGNNDTDKETILYAAERIDGIMSGEKIPWKDLLVEQDYLDKHVQEILSLPANLKFTTNALILQLFKYYAKKIKPLLLKAGVDKHEYYLKLYDQIRNSFIKAQERKSQSAEPSSAPSVLPVPQKTEPVAQPEPQKASVVVQPKEVEAPAPTQPVAQPAPQLEPQLKQQLEPAKTPIAENPVAQTTKKETQTIPQQTSQEASVIEKQIDPEELNIISEIVKSYAQKINNQILKNYWPVFGNTVLDEIQNTLLSAHEQFLNKTSHEIAQLIITAINDNIGTISNNKQNKLNNDQKNTITGYFENNWSKKASNLLRQRQISSSIEKPIDQRALKIVSELVEKYTEEIKHQIIARYEDIYTNVLERFKNALITDTYFVNKTNDEIAALVITAINDNNKLFSDKKGQLTEKQENSIIDYFKKNWPTKEQLQSFVMQPTTQPATQFEQPKSEESKIVNGLVEKYEEQIRDQIVKNYGDIKTNVLEDMTEVLLANANFAKKTDNEIANVVIAAINDNDKLFPDKKDQLTEKQKNSVTQYFVRQWPTKEEPKKVVPKPIALQPTKEPFIEKEIARETIDLAEQLVKQYKEQIENQIVNVISPSSDSIIAIVDELFKKYPSLGANTSLTIADLIINACIKNELKLDDTNKDFIRTTLRDYQ